MKNACLLVHCISSFEGTSYKRIQDTASLPVPLFLVVLHRIRIYISRYHFEHLLKKDFRHEFLFFNGFTQTHRPLAKRDKSFLLMLPKFGKFLVLYLGCGSMT